MAATREQADVIQFVIFLHKTTTKEPILLNDLTKNRWDLCCRIITAGLIKSHGTRRNAQIILFFPEEGALVIDGDEVRHLRPDERNTASLISQLLLGNTIKGFSWHPKCLLPTVVDQNADIIKLEEGGSHILPWKKRSQNESSVQDDSVDFIPQKCPNLVFILGDNQDLNEQDDKIVQSLGKQNFAGKDKNICSKDKNMCGKDKNMCGKDKNICGKDKNMRNTNKYLFLISEKKQKKSF